MWWIKQSGKSQPAVTMILGSFYDDFKNINPDTVIITNSKLAFDCCKSLNVKPQPLSQRLNGKEKWVKAIVNAIK